MSKLPTISIVIPSQDKTRKDNVSKLLDDIARQKIEANVEIFQIQGVSSTFLQVRLEDRADTVEFAFGPDGQLESIDAWPAAADEEIN